MAGAIGTLLVAVILIVVGCGTYLAYSRRLRAIGRIVFVAFPPFWVALLVAVVGIFWLFFVRGRP
jgi:FtsH-binding integral membrane protein